MYPMIDLGFIEIPTYWILNILGVYVAYRLIKYNNQKHKDYRLPKQDILFLVLYIIIGAILGSRLLFIITYIPSMIAHPEIILTVIFRGGSVFFGGAIGGFLAAILYIKLYGLDPIKYFNLLVISVPLGHAFGRVGCFLAGCCYGEYTDSFLGVYFPAGPVHTHPIGPVYPTQLFAVAYNLLIFAILIYLFYKLKKHKPYFFLGLYLVVYSVFRFINEFYRGDDYRGIWLLSTSQWISIALFIFGLYILFGHIEKYRWFHQTEPKSKAYRQYLSRLSEKEV